MNVPRKQVYISLPFLGDVQSSRIVRRINAAVQAVYPAANVLLRYGTLRALTRTSLEVFNELERAGVVYKFSVNIRRSISAGQNNVLRTAPGTIFQNGLKPGRRIGRVLSNHRAAR